MTNPRGAGAPRGRGRGRGGGRGRQPRVNPEPNQPEQNEMQEMRRTLQEQQALINTLLERQNRQDREAERQLERRQNEEEHNNEEEENEQSDGHDEESEGSERSQSPPRRGRAVQTTQQWVTQFCKLKPPTFHGKNELAEDWLMSLDKIFEVMECPGNRKAQLAIYKLDGDAHRWWKSVSTTLQSPVTWEMFLEQFNEQYFPSSIQVIKEEEFLQIQQGNEESFDDYFARFTNLSRYSSYLKIYKNESWKANRLVTGLKYDIRARLVSQKFSKMAKAVESCRRTERNLKELRILRNQNSSRTNRSEGNRENSSRKREAPWSDSQGESKRPARFRQQYNPGTSGPRPCPKCRKYHPQSTGCDGKLICFKCQKPGHISVYCPEKAAASRPQNPGRMYALTDTMDKELPERVQGTIS